MSSLIEEFDRLCEALTNGSKSADEYVQELDSLAKKYLQHPHLQPETETVEVTARG